MERRMRSEEGWELSHAESLGWLCPKSVAEKKDGVRGLRDCVTPFHTPVRATQGQQSQCVESCTWREREMERKSCLLRGQDDRETVRKHTGSEKASTGGFPGSSMGSSKPAVSAAFLCGARPQPWNRDLPTSVNPVPSPLEEQQMVLTAKPIPIFNS